MVPRIRGNTSGAERHRIGINLVGELGLRTDGEDGGGHEGDGALDGRHIDQLTVEGRDDNPVRCIMEGKLGQVNTCCSTICMRCGDWRREAPGAPWGQVELGEVNLILP